MAYNLRGPLRLLASGKRAGSNHSYNGLCIVLSSAPPFLDQEALPIVIHALVTSHLDYDNGD